MNAIYMEAKGRGIQRPWKVISRLMILLGASGLFVQAAPKSSEPKSKSSLIPESRKVSSEELAAHVSMLSSSFSIRKRETDPFGRLQDPEAKPVIKPTMAATKRVAPQVTPFVDIIRMIKVTTIMPGERRFLIGNRTVSQGETIPIVFRGKNLSVEIVSVSSDKINFRKTDNGETAELKINLLPEGMKPGNDGVQAPGLFADNANAPIDLDDEAMPLDAAQYSR